MKVQFLTSYYKPFLNDFFSANPDLKNQSYQTIQIRLLEELFADTGALYYHTSKAGHEASIIISNCEILQKQWAKENNVQYREDKWMLDIAFCQIKLFKPDLFYLEYIFDFFGDFLKEVKPFCKYNVAWISTPLNNFTHIKGIDLILSSTPDFVEKFREIGLNAEYMHPAFDERILKKINTNSEKNIPFSFVGGWSTIHKNRKDAINQLVKHTSIQLWGYGYHVPFFKQPFEYCSDLFLYDKQSILNAYNGSVWGLEMYNILQRSIITFNVHEKLLKGYVGNMRMFEAAGVGTMILNDNGKNLSNLFLPGKEIESYNNINEAIEKINYYSIYPEKAIEIGINAQKRVLREYNYDRYVENLFHFVCKYSKELR